MTLTRRNVIKILGAAAALPAGAFALRETIGAPVPVQWQGETLGALTAMTLWHRDPSFARRTIVRMRAEIDRLENIFSLYRPESEIARLNRAGRLAAPSRDLVAVLDEVRRVATVSGGAFNPTVQPLWNAYTAHFTGAEPTGMPDVSAIAALTDFAAVDAASRQVAFARSGMALTLNGVAQGYITDRIADLLRNEGFAHAMVELGETRAIGAAPDGKPFTVSLMKPGAPSIVDRSVKLADQSLSVSGGYGQRFGQSTDAHHIFDPVTGRSANRLLDVAVIHPRATIADALSTTIFVAGEAAAPAILAAYRPARAILTRADGTGVTI